MLINFDNVQLGFSADLPPEKLPAGAWTDSRNVIFRDGAAEKMKGYAPALGSLSFTSTYLATISDGVSQFWAYARNGASTSAVYATDGSTHANISSASYTLTAEDNLGWNGGAFHGYLIFNESTRDPQYWSPSLSNKIQPLTNWPANTQAKVIRTFKDFLFALRVTDTGTYNPRLLRWSDLAAPASLPGSWDFTDPTNRAGRKEFGETSDNLVDCLALRDSIIVYKEQNTWIGSYVDLPDVFDFRTLFSESGLISEDCVRAFKSRHFAVTTDDIILHDGNSAESLVSRRMRRWLFNKINTSRYRRSFLMQDNREREMLFCFPEAGYDWPNLALVWNWDENTFGVRELGSGITFGTQGVIPGTNTSFNSDSGTFDSDSSTFDEETYSPFQVKPLITNAGSQQAFQIGTGEFNQSATLTCYVTRSYIPIDTSPEHLKRVLSLRPRVHGTVGDVVSVYIGLRSAIDDPVTFQGPYEFSIGETHKIDLLDKHLVGRWLDLKVQYEGTNTFRLYGIEIEAKRDGKQ